MRRTGIRRPAVQVLIFIVLATAVRIVLACVQEPDPIETYHWLYAQHPAAAYFDHPGMIGWWIWLSTSAFGDSLLAIRLPTILGGGAAMGLAFLAGRRMYDDRAGRLAALLVGLVPLTARFSMEATPDGPLLCFWMAAVWALSHALPREEFADRYGANRPPVLRASTGWWILAGAFAGAALDSKYTAIFLPAGLALFLLSSREHRFWLARLEPWLAAAAALAVFWPTIEWNARHEWQSFAYQGVERVRSSEGFTLSYADLFVRRQLLLVTPAVLLWAAVAGVRTVARWSLASWADRLNTCLGLPMLLLFFGMSFFRSVRAHWPVAGYLSLFLLSAAAVECGGRWGRRLHGATLVTLAALGIGWTVHLSLLPVEQVRPWSAVAREIEREPACFVIAPDYHHAAMLAWYVRPRTVWDLTPAGGGGKSFRDWWRPGLLDGQDALIVTSQPYDASELEAIRACFSRVEPLREIAMEAWDQRPKKLLLWRASAYRPPVRLRKGPEDPRQPPPQVEDKRQPGREVTDRENGWPAQRLRASASAELDRRTE